MEMAPSELEIYNAPLYVAEPSEPLFIQNSFTEVHPPVQSSKMPTKMGGNKMPKQVGGNFKPYQPGAMLAESAFMTSTFGQQFGSPAFGNDLIDKESESDCSTTDTSMRTTSFDANEAMTSMQMAASDGSGYMMPNLGMMAENPWQSYAAAGYWGMPYAPPVPAQQEQPWPQQMPMTQFAPQENAGSSGHRLGRCKPCAFMYKDGCRSGAECPYCHLCPPGEKQRRKRVMRSMQRNMVPP